MYLGSDSDLMGCMSRCRGQFVHIPSPENNSETEDDSSDESDWLFIFQMGKKKKNIQIPSSPERANPRNHREYEDRASCCKMYWKLYIKVRCVSNNSKLTLTGL